MKRWWMILMVFISFTQEGWTQKSTFVQNLGVELPSSLPNRWKTNKLPKPLKLNQDRIEAVNGWTIYTSGSHSWVLKKLEGQTRSLSMKRPEPVSNTVHGFIFCCCGDVTSDFVDGCEIEFGSGGAFRCPDICMLNGRTEHCNTAILYLHEDGTTSISYWNE